MARGSALMKRRSFSVPSDDGSVNLEVRRNGMGYIFKDQPTTDIARLKEVFLNNGAVSLADILISLLQADQTCCTGGCHNVDRVRPIVRELARKDTTGVTEDESHATVSPGEQDTKTHGDETHMRRSSTDSNLGFSTYVGTYSLNRRRYALADIFNGVAQNELANVLSQYSENGLNLFTTYHYDKRRNAVPHIYQSIDTEEGTDLYRAYLEMFHDCFEEAMNGMKMDDPRIGRYRCRRPAMGNIFENMSAEEREHFSVISEPKPESDVSCECGRPGRRAALADIFEVVNQEDMANLLARYAVSATRTG